MNIYTYAALDKDNSYVKSQIKERTEKRAIKFLQEEGFLVINIKKEKNNRWQKILNYSSVSRLDKIYLTRQLHSFLEAGIAIDQAVKISAEQVDNKKLKEILFTIHEDIQSGQPLSDSLNKYKKYFSQYYIQLIKIGERSGKLDNILKHLLDQQEKDYELISKVRGAMIYPIILILAAIGIVIFMLSFVVPTISQVLSEWGSELPWTTKMLISVSNFLVVYGIIVLPIIILFFLGLILLIKKVPQAKWYYEEFLFSFPLIKKIAKEYNIARILISISTPIQSGISIDESLRLAIQTCDNIHYRQSIEKGVSFVRKGIPLSEVLLGYPGLYPPNVTRMIEMGEKTGKLDSMFYRISVFYEKSVYNTFNNISTIIEPFLLLFIGFIVGFIAVSILTPIWRFSESM